MEDYAAITWLKYMMSELDIDVKELASVIGKSTKQVERYRNDGFPHNKNRTDIQKQCIEYIYKKSCFKTYHHIENRIFLVIFRNYFNALNNRPETRVSQNELAEFMGVKQKTISSWLNPQTDVKFSTEKQYWILNFLFSQSMKVMGDEMLSLKIPQMEREFDYWGYYAINQKLEYYLKFPKSFFYLMQNRQILSDVDKLMKDYIHLPLPLYLMLMRQFEVSFRYAKYLPSVAGHSSDYEQFDSTMFDTLLTDMAGALEMRKRLLSGEKITFLDSPSETSILQVHRQALQKCPFWGTKQQQLHEIEQVRTAILTLKTSTQNETEKDYRKLHQQFMQIIRQKLPPNEERIPQKIYPSKYEVANSLSTLEDFRQEMILNHISAFFDMTQSQDDAYYFEPFENTIFYPFMKAILCVYDKSSIISEIESEIFNYDFEQDRDRTLYRRNYKEIKTLFRKTHDSLQAYLSVGKLVCLQMENVSPTKNHFYEHELYKKYHDTAENEIRFLSAFDKLTFQSDFIFETRNVLEMILDKLIFSPEDWYLWGLVQVGMKTNPQKTTQKILDFLRFPDNILTFTGKKI